MSKLGIDGELHYRSGGDYGTPTWNRISDDVSVDFTITNNTAKSYTRTSRMGRSGVTTKDFEATLTINKTSADINELITATLDGNPRDFLVLDGPINVEGSQGYRFYGIVSQMTEPQGLEAVNEPTFNLMNSFPIATETGEFSKAVVGPGPGFVITYTPISSL